MKTYKSKFGFEIMMILTLLFGLMIGFMVYQSEPLEAILSVCGIFLLVYGICLYLNIATEYTIMEAGILKVECGFFYNKRFDINKIKSVRYAPDKWSIKQIVGHITDHERIKVFRAFLLSRNESVPLWGYDQNSMVENSRFEEMIFQQLITDFRNVRKASISFVDGLSKNQLRIKGMAGQYQITLEDFLKSIIGHETHHLNIVKERYF